MVVLNKIYTRTGDSGETSLVNGERVSKLNPIISAVGTVDELNAEIGIARLAVEDYNTDKKLERIQSELFDLGADIANPDESNTEALRVIDEQVEWLESEIDKATAELEPLRSFVLPGGAPLAAHLHKCRTVARRAERAAIAAGASRDALRYLNRLSDFFFVLARAANNDGHDDVLWRPGATRGA